MPEETNQGENKTVLPARDEKGRLLPGQCGNIKGHPKGQPNLKQRFRNELDRMGRWKAPQGIIRKLREQFPQLKDTENICLVEALRCHIGAMSGEWQAYDRIYDRPGQEVDLNHSGEIASMIQMTINLNAENAPEPVTGNIPNGGS